MAVSGSWGGKSPASAAAGRGPPGRDGWENAPRRASGGGRFKRGSYPFSGMGGVQWCS